LIRHICIVSYRQIGHDCSLSRDGSNRNTWFCLPRYVASRCFAMTSPNAPAEHVTLLISILPSDDAQLCLSVRLVCPSDCHICAWLTVYYTHPLMDWKRHTFKMAAMTSFHAEKCCHLLSALATSDSDRCICNSVRQFLIHSTFVLLVNIVVQL